QHVISIHKILPVSSDHHFPRPDNVTPEPRPDPPKPEPERHSRTKQPGLPSPDAGNNPAEPHLSVVMVILL
ncbi:MAG: hypothetical protein OXC91_00600, partial [Rhodobacteraceae bacterium]|nr:hypothetical protein [Paracoccaceae bacterium]